MAKTIDDGIAELEALTSPQLRARWQDAFGKPAPKRASRDLLLRALAYRLQEQAEGGLRPATRGRLAKLAGLNGEDPKLVRSAAQRLKPGSRLVREWRGEVHQVTVLDDGFDYRGTRYGNLLSVPKTHPPPSGEFSEPTGRYQARRFLRRLAQNPLDLSGQGSVTVR